MVEIEDLLSQMQITRPDHLPVVAAFCRRIGLINVIDRIVPNEMEVSFRTSGYSIAFGPRGRSYIL